MLRTLRRSLLVSVLTILSSASLALADTVRLGVNSTGLGAALDFTPTGRLTGCNGTACFYEFERGTTVTVTARAKRPSTFARWLGACSGNAVSCRILLDDNNSLTARFSPIALYTGVTSPYEGSISLDPLGPDCGAGCHEYPYGARVTITASPADARVFTGWLGPACGPITGNVCPVTLFNVADAQPTFRCVGTGPEDCVGSVSSPIEREVLTTVRVQGRGSVRINGKVCTSTRPCAPARYQRGTVLALRADGGFVGWSGACTGRVPRCQISAFRDANGKLPVIRALFTS